MSSNIRLEKICQHCNSVFVAKTTKTKFCGLKCSSKAYKKRKREEKIGVAIIETKQKIKLTTKIDIQEKDILNVSDASILVGCSKKTIYRLITEGKIRAHNFSERITRISRSEINIFLETPISNNKLSPIFKRGDYYTISELQDKYQGQYSKSSIFQLLKTKEVRKVSQHKKVFVLKEEANNALNS
jgi:excisionase family DNA binding protein